MPLNYRFYEDQKVILTTWSGVIDNRDLIHFYMGIYNNKNWRPGFNEIIDLRDAELADISNETLAHISELATTCLKGSHVKLAIISPSELSRHITRIYEAFSHIPNEATKVIHHLNEALEWLEQ